jgi:hypothetical protein
MENGIVDLTRRADGKLNGISLKSIKIPECATSLPIYLQEVNLGANLRAAYFTEGIPADKDLFYYNLVWMKIPTGFSYVEYSRNATTGEISVGTRIPTNMEIIAPIMSLHDKDDADVFFHICDIQEVGPGGQNGCSVLCSSYSQSAALRTASLTANTPPEKPFFMFNYNGKLRTSEIDKQGKIHVEERDGDYYLFPLILSDKTVVYYALNGEDPEVFKILFEDAILPRKKYVDVDINHPLTMNDALGVFVTSKVNWVFPKP